MTRMVRKQIYIEAKQEELLKQRARELGVSEVGLLDCSEDHRQCLQLRQSLLARERD